MKMEATKSRRRCVRASSVRLLRYSYHADKTIVGDPQREAGTSGSV